MIFRGLTTLILIAVIVGAVLLGQQHFKQGAPPPHRPQTSEPGYSARDAELTETGPDGRPLYRLNAATVRESPRDGSVQLDDVQMTYRGENSNQWSLTAEHGSVRQSNEHIELTGHVRAVGVMPGTTGVAQFLSDRLFYDTQTDTATTPDPVTVLWSGRELQGTGLIANLKERRFRLESNVHGRFLP